MEQTRLLLIASREDYSEALNLLCLIQMQAISSTIEDTMYAHMVARDWIEWIKNPQSSNENPLYGQDLSSIQDCFEHYAFMLARSLVLSENEVEEFLKTVNPNLIYLLKAQNRLLQEDCRLFYRSLRYAAELFEETLGDSHLNEILKEKNVPPMSELGECITFKHETDE